MFLEYQLLVRHLEGLDELVILEDVDLRVLALAERTPVRLVGPGLQAADAKNVATGNDGGLVGDVFVVADGTKAGIHPLSVGGINGLLRLGVDRLGVNRLLVERLSVRVVSVSDLFGLAAATRLVVLVGLGVPNPVRTFHLRNHPRGLAAGQGFPILAVFLGALGVRVGIRPRLERVPWNSLVAGREVHEIFAVHCPQSFSLTPQLLQVVPNLVDAAVLEVAFGAFGVQEGRVSILFSGRVVFALVLALFPLFRNRRRRRLRSPVVSLLFIMQFFYLALRHFDLQVRKIELQVEFVGGQQDAAFGKQLEVFALLHPPVDFEVEAADSVVELESPW